MDLYLIRHADAVPLGFHGITEDAERPLSADGELQARELAATLKQHGVQLDQVIASPLLRAMQTAQGMLQAWSEPVPPLTESSELKPGGSRKRLSRYLREGTVDAVALIGHEPDLSQYVAWLIGSKKVSIDMAKAGLAHVRCEDGPGKGTGTLVALVTPAWYSAPAPTPGADGPSRGA
jgi:phosphohistidine phosphatase